MSDALAKDDLADVIRDVLSDVLSDLDGPRAYSVAEVAERLSVSQRTVYRLIEDGYLHRLPHVSLPRIAKPELEAFIAARAS